MEKPLLDKVVIKSKKSQDALSTNKFETFHEVLALSKSSEDKSELVVGDLVRIIDGAGNVFISDSFELIKGESLRIVSYSSILTKLIKQ
jgi:hypothetical protein